MKRDQLAELSMQFSVDILNLIEELQTRPGQTIPLQVERSATSICANIAEGKYAQSRADFISKFHIALKEANETGKWLEMLYLTKKIDGMCHDTHSFDCLSEDGKGQRREERFKSEPIAVVNGQQLNICALCAQLH